MIHFTTLYDSYLNKLVDLDYTLYLEAINKHAYRYWEVYE